jgi:hypothetical protein
MNVSLWTGEIVRRRWPEMCDCESKVMHVQGPSPEPFKVKIMKMSKGYQWEISVHGKDFDDMLKMAKTVDDQLKLVYANAGTQEA